MKYISKRFLSTDYDETGAMVCKVEVTKLEDMHRWSAEHRAVDAEVSFRDCNGKPIYLQFCMDNEDHPLAARLEKVDLIIHELTKFKQALIKADAEVRVVAAEWLAKNNSKEDE